METPEEILDGRGLSMRQLLLEVRAAQKAHIDTYNRDQLRIQTELSHRPTRKEVISWIGASVAAAGLLVSFIFSLIENLPA